MLNIGEFARLGQVSPRMLRHYDETGLLKPHQVDPQTGYRLYDVASLGRLRALERSSTMPRNDVVIKQTEPIRLAEAVGTAPGYGSDNLGPLFARLLPEVLEHLQRRPPRRL
jgi:DNA-binding transcriptional MerR regulator